MDVDAPAAAQISQADIIERQAESIARLKRQVQKGVEYKQLTKSKLKEAAVRLKEYRVRVETLLGDVETLQKQLKVEKRTHEKTKKNHKNVLMQDVKTLKRKANATTQTQTQEPNNVTRTCQTLLSGQVEQVNKRTMMDHGVQTFDTLPSRKRGREQNVALLYHQLDQIVPKCSRRPQKDPMENSFTQGPLQVLGSVGQTTFLQETSAALDAELAFSDLEDENGQTRDTLTVKSGLEDASGQCSGFNPKILDKIDKELDLSGNEEEQDSGAALVDDDGHLLLGCNDQVLSSNIEKKVGSSSEKKEGRDAQPTDKIDNGQIGGRTGFAAGEKNAVSVGFDFAISNAIDKDLESSGGEEDGVNVGGVVDAKKAEQTDTARENGGDVSQSKWTLMSIDDELDDEFAALEADSDRENHEKAESSSSGGSSCENDSSDSSDSDADDDRDDPMTGGIDSVTEDESLDPMKEKNEEETTALQAKRNSELEVLSLSPLDKDAVVLTTPVEKKFVGASEDAYSLTADALAVQNQRMQLDTCAALMVSAEEKNLSIVAVNSQPALFPKSVSSCIQPSDDVIDDASTTAVSDALTSSNNTKSAEVPVLKQLTPVTSFSSRDEPTELELDPAMSIKQPSNHTSLDLPGTPIESGKQSAKAIADKQSFSILPATEVSTIGKFRKADKANLEDCQASSHKKIRLNDASRQAEAGARMAIPQTKSSTADRKKKSAVGAKAKEKLRLKKSLSIFKQSLKMGTGEEPDKKYTRRTITALVNHCCKFVDTHLDHVITLCKALADAYRELGISPMLVVRGSLSLFRTPRTRRLMPESNSSSWLCNQVLMRVVCSGNEELERDGTLAPKSSCLSMVDECLVHLRGFLIEERTHVGEYLSENRVHVPVTTRQVNVTHDKVFLAHICALHTHLCRSTGQLVRSRVLLFDLVRDHPNIRGLYFAMVMLEIYPAILEREFDQHCTERQMVLKETLQQALVVISGVAAAKQELLLLQPSTTMLHTIADALQMPELEEVDGSDFSFQCSCVKKLFNKVVVLCQSSKFEQQADEVRSPVSADYFALAKSMEICTAVYGADLVVKIFNVERCQELFSKANIEGKIGIMHLVGHIAMGIGSKKTSDMHASKTSSWEYIESVTDWMCHILSTNDRYSPEDRFRLTFGCSTMCVELILEYSAVAGLKSQRQVLCAVVRWFDAMPSDRLMDLPATFLRRFRLAVVAARPQMLPR